MQNGCPNARGHKLRGPKTRIRESRFAASYFGCERKYSPTWSGPKPTPAAAANVCCLIRRAISSPTASAPGAHCPLPAGSRAWTSRAESSKTSASAKTRSNAASAAASTSNRRHTRFSFVPTAERPLPNKTRFSSSCHSGSSRLLLIRLFQQAPRCWGGGHRVLSRSRARRMWA